MELILLWKHDQVFRTTVEGAVAATVFDPCSGCLQQGFGTFAGFPLVHLLQCAFERGHPFDLLDIEHRVGAVDDPELLGFLAGSDGRGTALFLLPGGELPVLDADTFLTLANLGADLLCAAIGGPARIGESSLDAFARQHERVESAIASPGDGVVSGEL